MPQRCMATLYALMTLLVPVAAWSVAAWSVAAQSRAAPTCTPSGPLLRIAGVSEASGLAASRATPGRLWTHNDSGKPELVALDVTGKVTGRFPVSGATFEDWEAIASAPCGNRTCLYLADIGDNGAKRKDIVVYRVPEPAAAGGAAAVDGVFRATYPDGAHDAEALLAAADGRLYIVTKGDAGPIALYRFPRELRADQPMRLERVGETLSDREPAPDARVTDGAISPDGAWVVLRTRVALTFYRAAEFLTGSFRESHRVDLKPLGEPQGEGVAFGASSTVYVAGEGAGKQGGTLAALSCAY